MIILKVSPELKEVYGKWKTLINMTYSELDKFIKSDEGKVAGLTREEASNAGADGGKIKTGRDSARAILRMKKRPYQSWTKNDWEWAKRQIRFVSRMLGVDGPLRDKKGKPTRKLLSLKIWGHDPEK